MPWTFVTPSGAAGWTRRLRQAAQVRRMLGLRFFRRVTVLRGPVRVVLNLSLHPSLSLTAWRWTVNLNYEGVHLRGAPLPHIYVRQRLWRWPWRGGGHIMAGPSPRRRARTARPTPREEDVEWTP